MPTLNLDGVSGFEPENADIKDRCRNHLAIPQKVEREKGFEPTRDLFVDDQSTTWPTILWFPHNLKIGDGMEIRTPMSRINSPVLYRVSYPILF